MLALFSVQREHITNPHVCSELYSLLKYLYCHFNIIEGSYVTRQLMTQVLIRGVTAFVFQPQVLHTVGPQWHNYPDKDECLNQLLNTFMNCMERANKNKWTSIAFPAISSGNLLNTA